MKYRKNSAEYEVNWEAFREMDDLIPMTRPERKALMSWTRRGYDVDTNPWNYTDGDGWPLNFLQAYRLKNGYSNGPWDYWKGPDRQPLWDDERDRFIAPEDYC